MESPTIEEKWLKGEWGRRVCGGEYEEKIVRERVEKVMVLKGKDIKIVLK